jgi:hypothetical protein
MKLKKEKVKIREGRIARVSDTHCGVGWDGTSYILEPDDVGLVVHTAEGIVTLFVCGDLIDVREYSLEIT